MLDWLSLFSDQFNILNLFRYLTVIAVAACSFRDPCGRDAFGRSLAFPFFNDLVLPLGWLFVWFGGFISDGTGNGVNLTDGLAGLAIGPVMIAAGCFGIFAYVVGNA